MEKRGQVYILAVIIIAIVLFGLTVRMNFVQKKSLEDDFESLSKNYERESAKFTNYIISDIPENDFERNFLDFTVQFSRYSKTQNPDFGLVYLFDHKISDQETLFMGNYLDLDMVVGISQENVNDFDEIAEQSPENIVFLEGCKSRIRAGTDFDIFQGEFPIDIGDIQPCSESIPSFPSTYYVLFLIGNIIYKTEITPGVPEILVVSHELVNNQRKVLIKDAFILGTVADINDICLLPIPTDSNLCDCETRDARNCEVNEYCKLEDGICCSREGECNNPIGNIEISTDEDFR